MYAYNTHYDTLWYTILQYFTLPQNDPPWIDKGIQWPLRRFLHLPQFTNLSKQLMDNNILSKQLQQHISQNNYGQQQRLQTPQTILSVVKPKIRNYIHMS